MQVDKDGNIYYDYHVKSEKEEIAETAWKSVFHWLYAIVGVLFVLFISLIFFIRIIEVNGTSMIPTLNAGDKILVSTHSYVPVYGDIIVVGSQSSNEPPLVKRVIATDNQTVLVDYVSGTVSVDGEILTEPYIYEKMTTHANSEITYPYTVPSGYVFVMGDNRNDSSDSRNKFIGCIDKQYIIGKAVIRIFPVNEYSIY